MNPRTSKRVYTVQGLDYWFSKLEEDWEPSFSVPEIEWGRQIYRRGQVRELEFRQGTAVMHCETEEQNGYAVVDWNGAGLEVRYSVEQKSLGRSMAVAGLYELEEVLAEEVPFMLFDEEQVVEEDKPQPSEEKEEEVKEPTRQIGLDFRLEKDRELEVRMTLDGKLLSQESDEGCRFGQNMRASMVRLTALARKAAFFYSKRREAFFLNDAEKILCFFTAHFPSWEKKFPVNLSPDVKALAQTPQDVDLSAIARKELGNQFSLKWQFRVGNRLLSEEEMEQLYRSRKELFIVKGAGFARLPKERRSLLREWRENHPGFSRGRWPAYMLFSLFRPEEGNLQLDDGARKWKDALGTVNRRKKIDLPSEIRSYQREGVECMNGILELGCHALLADEMGLGKTLQALALFHARPVKKLPSLVVCPASVVPVWQGEVERFFPGTTVEVLKTGNDFSLPSKPILWIASYTQLRRHKHLLKGADFGYVVLDEAQHIKNPDAKVTQACFSINGRHRLVLTGTPVENTPLDLWTLFRFLMPGLLGGRKAFEEGLACGGKDFLENLRTQIRPFTIRRTKQQVARELPEKVESVVKCPLSEAQHAEYRRIIQEGVQEVGEDVQGALSNHAINFLSLLTRLRQVCIDPSLLPWNRSGNMMLSKGSGKIREFLRRMEEILSRGHKVVVFSQFVTLLQELRPVLEKQAPGLKIFELYGDTRDRGKVVRRFQSRKGSGVILVSLRAGGTGITLHAADYVFLMDPWWNPAVEKQAVDRVHRIGQEKTVFVYRMIAAGTIEERIQELKAGKELTFRDLIGALEEKLQARDEPFHNLRKLLDVRA